MDHQAFFNLTLIITTALLVSGLMKFFKQPLVIGYILTGVILSPSILSFFNLNIDFGSNLSVLSKIGISILLFTVGLNLNFKFFKEISKITLIASISQVIFTVLTVFGIGKLFGLDNLNALLIGLAVSFSSTIIITKLLADKNSLETLHGRIAVGYVIIQDLLGILILMTLYTIPGSQNWASTAIESISLAFLLTISIFILARKILPPIINSIAKSQEMLLLFAIGWCLSIAGLFGYLNFSIEIGAFIAGLSLANSAYKFEIASKLKPLRDFFVMIFFVMLGTKIIFSDLPNQIGLILALTTTIIIGNFLFIMTLMGLSGYQKRNSFMIALTSTQVGEFALKVGSVGIALGIFEKSTLSVLAMICLISIAFSTYCLAHSEYIFSKLAPFLQIFEKKKTKAEKHQHDVGKEHHVLLFGYSKIGPPVISSLKSITKNFLIVDYDPQIIKQLKKDKLPTYYADIGNTETLQDFNFENCKMIISSMKDVTTNINLIKKVRSQNSEAIIIGLSHYVDGALSLYEAGADYVIMPHDLGGEHTSILIDEFKFDLDKFSLQKHNHIKKLLIKRQLSLN